MNKTIDSFITTNQPNNQLILSPETPLSTESPFQISNPFQEGMMTYSHIYSSATQSSSTYNKGIISEGDKVFAIKEFTTTYSKKTLEEININNPASTYQPIINQFNNSINNYSANKSFFPCMNAQDVQSMNELYSNQKQLIPYNN